MQNVETSARTRPSEVSSNNSPSDSDSALRDYLGIGSTIKLLDLPKSTNDGYPALAVDAASGTGKTQQAFAFLAQGYHIVYLLCTSPKIGGSQLIYYAMDRKVEAMRSLLSNLENHLLSENLKEKDMSIESLTDSITKLKARPSLEGREPRVIAVNDLARNLYRCLIKCSKDNTTVEMVSQDYASVSFKVIATELQDKVLFVDEAIPAARLQNEKEREGLLRLLRNMARVLQMRAVMAGTASCLPNMMRTSDHSRISTAQTKWMECHLYWQSMKTPPTSLRELGASVLRKHRPLFLLLLQDLRKQYPQFGLGELLNQAGENLEIKKSISLSGKFHWLSGAWLEGGRKVPSAFNTMAPDLVRGHFFEPGITVLSGTKKP